MSERGIGALARGAALLGALAWTACATTSEHPFDRYAATGRYPEAARAFETDSTLWSRPDALLTAARFYADPVLPTFDVYRARAALERLTGGFPRSAEAQEARPLRGLLAELATLREELESRSAELEGRAALADTLAASREAAERDLQALRRRVESLEGQLEEARRELERLKAVDLRPRPGDPR